MKSRPARTGIDALVAVGPDAAAIHAGADAVDPGRGDRRWTVDDVDAAAALLAEQVADDDVVLVKASRSAGLERVVDRLADLRATSAPTGEVGA